MKQIIIEKTEEIGKALDFAEEVMIQYKVAKEVIIKRRLLIEETLIRLAEHSEPDNLHINIRAWKIMGSVQFEMSSKGEEFKLISPIRVREDADEYDESTIRDIMLRSYGEELKYVNQYGVNKIRIPIEKNDKKNLYLTVLALILALVFSSIIKQLPDNIGQSINTYFLIPVKTMYLNALKMVVAPVVFFSIATCVAQFNNMKEFGKIGAKVMGLYLLTTVMAIGVGLLMFYIIKPGNPGLITGAVSTFDATAAEGVNVDIVQTIVGIVPSNIVKPFLDADMLQIIFIAVLCGVSMGMIGEYSKPLRTIVEACNTLFLKITTLIVSLIPLAVFCSIGSLFLKTDMSTMIMIAEYFGAYVSGLLGIIVIYLILVLTAGRLNPVIFIKKFIPTFFINLGLGSSNASMPYNMQFCTNKLGISRKVSSFAIPFGATVNMDGSCVYLALTTLFLARVYGVDIPTSVLGGLCFSIFILSMGAPGIPGSGLICLYMLIVQVGVPVEAVGLIMGIDPILGMMRAASNSAGDVAVSTIVARSEGLLDIEVYNKL